MGRLLFLFDKNVDSPVLGFHNTYFQGFNVAFDSKLIYLYSCIYRLLERTYKIEAQKVED